MVSGHPGPTPWNSTTQRPKRRPKAAQTWSVKAGLRYGLNDEEAQSEAANAEGHASVWAPKRGVLYIKSQWCGWSCGGFWFFFFCGEEFCFWIGFWVDWGWIFFSGRDVPPKNGVKFVPGRVWFFIR